MTDSKQIEQALRYIYNAGGGFVQGVKLKDFEDDHAPIGRKLISLLYNKDLIALSSLEPNKCVVTLRGQARALLGEPEGPFDGPRP